MQLVHNKSSLALRSKDAFKKEIAGSRRITAPWRPTQSSLTREELQKIVREVLG